AGTGDRLDVFDIDGHAFEVGRVLHVGAGLVPFVDFAFRHVQTLPALVAGEHVAVAGHEHVRVQGTADGVVDFRLRRPDVLQVDVVAVRVLAQRVFRQVGVDGAGQGVGDDQGRAGQEVHAHVAVYAAFEVAVAGQYRRHVQAVAVDGFADRLRQRTRVADAGGAAVADQVETEP